MNRRGPRVDPPLSTAADAGESGCSPASPHGRDTGNAEIRALLGAFPDWFFRVSRQYVVLDFAGGDQRPCCLGDLDPVGRHLREVFPADAAETLTQAVDGAIESEEIQECRFSLMEDGTLAHYEARIGGRGSPDVVVHFRKINPRKQTAQESRNSDLRLNAFFTRAPAGLAVFDRGCRYVAINDTLAEFNGRRASEHIGKKPSEIYGANEFTAMIEAQTLEVLRTGEPLINCELSGKVPSQAGAVRTWQCSRFPFRDAAGAITGVGVIVVDVTQRKQAEQALIQSEQRFRLHFQNNPIPIYTWQKEGDDFVLRDFNAAAERITKGGIHTFLGAGASQIYASTPEILGDLKACFENQEPVSREMKYWFQLTGEMKDLVVRYIYVPPDFVMVHTVDVTERRQAEQSLRESESKLRSITASSPDFITLLDREGIIQFINRTHPDYTTEQVLGTSAYQYVPRHAREKMAECLSRVFRTGDPDRFEADYRTLAGETVHFESRVCPVVRDGEIVAVTVNATDVTERLRTEQAIRENEEQYRVLLENHINGVAVIVDARLAFVNDSLCQLGAYTREQLLGRCAVDFMAAEDRERVLKDLETALAGDQISTAEYTVLSGDGRRIPVEVSSRPIRFQSTPAVLVVLRDLTARKQAEELAKRRTAELSHVSRINTLGEMASEIAHELNQPLSAVAAYAAASSNILESASIRADVDKIAELLAKIEAQSLRAGRIIHRIRNLATKREPTRTSCRINESIREAAALLEPEARMNQIVIRLELDENIPRVVADPIQIEQVLLNLMRNAVEVMAHSSTDEKCLTVSSRPCDNGTVEMTVSDTGPGIPDNQIGQVFDAFVTTKQHGMGLGLAISQSIVKAHKGRLAILENTDSGVTFSVTLPTGEAT